jgi:hypothetical protein
MQHWRVKWVERNKEGKNRESGISLTQKAKENNDSGELQQLVYGHLNVAQDGAEEAGTKSLAGMNWNGGDSSVLMPEKNVAATGSNDLKTDSAENSYDFLAFQPGKPSHTEICWMPTSSSGPT